MATSRDFNEMVDRYLPNELLVEEVVKRSWFLEKVDRDDDWKGGTIDVPFRTNRATSISFGSLTDADDVHTHGHVKGAISAYKEAWGTMKFKGTDWIQHTGKGKVMVNEQSFLKGLPEMIEDFAQVFKDSLSINLLSGANFASLTSDSTANDGACVVDYPERFEIGQKCQIDDDNSVATTGYVKSININTSTIVLVTARGGSTVLDFSAVPYTVAQNAKIYLDNAQSNSFTSLKSQLLSAAAGGSSTLFGQTKTLYPFLQSYCQSGASITSSNLLDKLFDHWTVTKRIGKGNPTDVLISYKHLGTVMKLLEQMSGTYRHVSTKASIYNYTEIVVVGVKGQMKLVACPEMPDDVIFFLDWRGIKFYSNGFIRKQVDPNGNNYYVVRATTGYSYLLDWMCFGELVVENPSAQGVLYSVSY
jgi:hypothetical protein